MNVLVFTFFGSTAGVLLQRAAFFYTSHELHFGAAQNLLLALANGLAYIAGASVSHGATRRLGERRTLQWNLSIQAALFLIAAARQGWGFLAALVALSFLTGGLWPVVESYVTAGSSPSRTASAIGRFNVTWGLSSPVALWAAAPLVGSFPRGLFLAGAAVQAVALLMTRTFPAVPPYLPDNHPERPHPELLRRYVRLCDSARWSMTSSYMMLFLLAPLMPDLFARLQVAPAPATALSSVLDVFRELSFAMLRHYVGWHGRPGLLAAAALLLPVSFASAIASPWLAGLLAAEAVFGLTMGMAYYAALYYAIVIRNASVGAGGAHEGLIGLGFTLGPAAGLIGHGLAAQGLGLSGGMLAAAAPFALFAAWRSARALAARD